MQATRVRSPAEANLLFVPSLAVSWLAPTSHNLSCLDSSLGRVPACDVDDPGLIPPEANLMFVPSLAFSCLAPITPSINCLDSSLGRVPACDAGDPGSNPGGGKLRVCLQGHNQHYAPVPPPTPLFVSRVIINIMHLFLPPPHPTTGA